MPDQTAVTLTDLVPYQSVPDKFPHLYSSKSWQWAVKQRQHNGLAKAFRKVGKPHAHQTVILWVTQDDEDEQAAIARWQAEHGHPLPENACLILLVSL
jgi:hypothetical protein